MDAPSTPDSGDIVVRQDTWNGTSVFVLRTVPGPDPLVVQTRDAAIQQARTAAKREQVRIWLTNGDSEFTLVEDLGIVRTGRPRDT